MKSILLLDINNLFHGVRSKYGETKRIQILDYVKKLEEVGHVFTAKVAFNRQPDRVCGKYMHMLACHGFETHVFCRHVMLPMALRLADLYQNADCVVIGSNLADVMILFRWLKDKGKLTKCCAVDIPLTFKQVCEVTEIEEDILETYTPA